MSVNPKSNPFQMEPAGEGVSRAAAASTTAALQAELAVEKDRYLRLAADFDNFRKRTMRETVRSASAQKEAFIRELLSVIDNLERALGSAVSTSPEQLRRGVEMTLQQLTQLLRSHEIEPEESQGRPFDPLFHEAVSVRHDPARPHNVILETFQRGYRRGKEVFRPAKVVVNDLSHAEAGGGPVKIGIN